MGRVNAAELDAVTVDAYRTLMTLIDPLPSLQQLLPDHDRASIERAFHAEGEYYREHVGRGQDAPTLARLREDCVGVFNETLGSTLSADAYVGTLHFEPLPGALGAVQRLRALGLTLAVVANWDFGMHEHLEEAGFTQLFAAIVPAAGKPSPDGILRALAKLGVEPSRALHVGDEEADERAARAAGVRFAPAPLADAAATVE
jgi:beta-phosphoglucomutase-like phosphatase (HAD superfamily)